jgi:predicted aspartyl protease
MARNVRTRAIVQLALHVVLVVPIRGAPEARQIVAFEAPRGHLVAVRGGAGSLDDLRFLLDTGTSRTVVDRRVVLALGLRGTPDEIQVLGHTLPAERVRLPSLQFGPIRVAAFEAVAVDLTDLSRRIDWQTDVIVGTDVLRGKCFIVDYDRRRLDFTCTGDWRWRMRCDAAAPSVIAEVHIDGRRYRMLVDTGSDALAIFARDDEGAGDETVTADTLTGPVRLRRRLAQLVVLGGLHQRRVPVVVMPEVSQPLRYDGVLGVRFLAPRVQVDLARGEVSWGR